MTDYPRNLSAGGLLLAALFLSACGGGGGGGGGGGTVGIAASSPVVVTSANADQVAAASIDAGDSLAGSSESVLGVVPASVGSSSGDVSLVDTVVEQVLRLTPDGGGSVSAAAVQNQNQNCDSGTLSFSFNDADNDLSLSTGDTLNMTANSCVFSGVSMNGGFSISNVVVTGDLLSAPYSLQFSLQTSGFTVSASGETVSMSGGGTITSATNDGVVFMSSFSGEGIQLSAGGDTLTLTDYQISETQNDATGAWSIDIDATVSSSDIGGSVRVTTVVALSGVGSANADSGQLTCAGNNSSVTLTVIDSANVQLDVDRDGDSVADDTFVVAWTAL